MSQSKLNLFRAVFAKELSNANKGKAFHSKAQAMADFAQFHKVKKAA